MHFYRRASSAIAVGLVFGVLAVSGFELGAVVADSSSTQQMIGKSVKGRAIVATHLGPNSAPIRIVVLGQMHGNEPAGRRVVSLLEARNLPTDVQLWLISTVNPDGSALGTRRNAHKVDLNRNFPNHWKITKKRSPYYAGPRVASEPETQGLMAFLSAVKPTAVISFHQSFGMVDDPYPRGHAAAKKLGELLGLRTGIVPCRGVCNGTMTGWVNAELQAIGITVELRSNVTPAAAQRAATAVIGLGAWLAGTPVPIPSPSSTSTPTPVPTPSLGPTPIPLPTVVVEPSPSA
ncbi:MAG: DUF2817 domain-containing protein [Actinomycetota bacterium]|nr:DUF2817 domain-containing protein [Actinomycetota bacterium]